MSKNRHNTQPTGLPRRQGSRFLSLMLIAGVFIIIDLIILLYFFWPGAENSSPPQEQHKVPAVEKQVETNHISNPSQQKE